MGAQGVIRHVTACNCVAWGAGRGVSGRMTDGELVAMVARHLGHLIPPGKELCNLG